MHDQNFKTIIGGDPSLELLLTVDEYPFAHDAGVVIPLTGKIVHHQQRLS